MTRDHDYVGARTAHAVNASTSAASTTYPLRLFASYQRLIEKGERLDPDTVVDEYARANPGIDLEARTTFAEWMRGSLPGDTAERPGGLLV